MNPIRDKIIARLTRSEAQIVAFLERGLTNREITTLLAIAPNTARNRVASAFKRVGASRAEFVNAGARA